MNLVENDVWGTLRRVALAEAEREPLLSAHLHDVLIRHREYPQALAYLIAASLANHAFNAVAMADLFGETIAANPGIVEASLFDLEAINTRDPASGTALVPFLYYKGFKALQGYRVAHALWSDGRTGLARFLQSRVAEVFAIDIHPAAQIGRGIFIDHGTGLVIGETCVIEDDVSILQSVTLGGTGKDIGDRHPKIRRGVLISAGAKILGNIEVGEGAKVGAGSVVLKPVAPHTTVVGVPARPVGRPHTGTPAFDMDQELEDG
jgi:serine O-acetyltransferase